ncbi:hypothetical protein B0O99DRAFT_743103 [Bisporella sp. PMI_857]|nr:hypothetical protein B0O99DRAFT_743103 [Bisporella sp. PMI_857]
MAQVSNPRQEANKFIPRLEASITRLDETCKALTLPSSLTDAQVERIRASIPKINQIWTRLRAFDAAIERDKTAKVNKLLTDGNARLSGPQDLIGSVAETNLLAIFGKKLPSGTAPKIAAYLHAAHPDLVLRFCAMVDSKHWIGRITWDIFSRLITRMKSATSQIWTTRMLRMFNRLRLKSLRGSEEYRAFHEQVKKIHKTQSGSPSIPNSLNDSSTLIPVRGLLNCSDPVHAFSYDPPSSIPVTQNPLTTQRQLPLSNSMYRSTGYGGSHRNYPDTRYQSGENQHSGAQSNDRQSQHMQHPASSGSQDIGHDTQAQDGFLIAQMPLHIETTSTPQSELSVYESMGFEFSFTNTPIDLILSFRSNPPTELLLLVEGMINSRRFKEERIETTCLGVYLQKGGDDALITFRTTPQIGTAIQNVFGIRKLAAG